jgi:hypothetical protein
MRRNIAMLRHSYRGHIQLRSTAGMHFWQLESVQIGERRVVVQTYKTHRLQTAFRSRCGTIAALFPYANVLDLVRALGAER